MNQRSLVRLSQEIQQNSRSLNDSAQGRLDISILVLFSYALVMWAVFELGLYVDGPVNHKPHQQR
jgi:hypothetical protein